MRWRAFVNIALGLVLSASISLLGPTRAIASDGPGPRIIGAQWLTAPLNSGDTELMEIRAQDADGVVSRINAFWGDGSFTHADLICFGIGQVATVRLDHVYQASARYVARVTAVSSPRCFGSSDQFSPKTRVRSPVEP